MLGLGLISGFLSRRNRTRVPCIELYIYTGFPRIRPNGLDLGFVGVEKLAEIALAQSSPNFSIPIFSAIFCIFLELVFLAEMFGPCVHTGVCDLLVEQLDQRIYYLDSPCSIMCCMLIIYKVGLCGY